MAATSQIHPADSRKRRHCGGLIIATVLALKIAHKVGIEDQALFSDLPHRDSPGAYPLPQCVLRYWETILGRTNEPSRQPCAADELGLSPQALNQITNIHSRKDGDAVLQGLNMLLENGKILRLSGELTRFCSRVSEFVDVINHYKADNADDADNDYYKFKLAVNEDIIKMALERTITEKFPRFSGEFEIITGSRMIEFQKQLILDIFDEILRQVSHYKDFRDGILQWDDAMKWG